MKKRYDTLMESKLFKTFSNVYVQDATHYKLAKHIAEYFLGSYSKKDNTATAKVQAIFNLTKGVFVDFKLCSFRNNDQGDASRFVKKMKKGELIIRDLGYAVLSVFKQISDKKAYFLSRFKYNIKVCQMSDDQEFDLNKILCKQGRLDQWVKLGASAQCQCRLIAIPLPDNIVNERRRKATKIGILRNIYNC